MKKLFVFSTIIFLFLCSFSYATRSVPTYHTKEQSIQMYKDLCVAHANLCSYESIGKSIQGKDIWMFKFGNPNGGKVLLDGNGHGPEDCGTEISYVFAKWMLESSDVDAIRARTNNYFMVIPVLNIDSYARQNARRSYTLQDGSIVSVPFGVDLNRNAPIGWGQSGSGDVLNNYEYRGLYANSEPETQAVVNTLQKYNPAVYVNTHCGMYLRNYAFLNNVTTKIISNTAKLAADRGVDLSNWAASQGCSGGHLCKTGGTYAQSGWIIEVATWADLPPTVEEYITKYYPKMHILWLGMLQSVEIEQSKPKPAPTNDYFAFGVFVVVLVAVIWYSKKK